MNGAARSVSAIALLAASAGMAGDPIPDADDLVEDFESYIAHTSLADLSTFVPLAGQTAPSGDVWKSTSPVFNHSGVVNNAIAQTGPNWNPLGSFFEKHGVPGGPDPDGAYGQFFAEPRGTIDPQALNTNFAWSARLDHQFYVPTATEPLVIVFDLYMDNLWTFAWFRPMSKTEGLIQQNIFVGGIDPCCPFVRCTCTDSPADFAQILGTRSDGESSFFELRAFEIPPKEWTRFALRVMPEGISFWAQNEVTLGVNPTQLPYDAPGYDGEMFAEGWAQLYPGISDDALTQVIEGPGEPLVYENIAGVWVPFAPMVVTDGSGERASPSPVGASIDEIQLLGGFDPPPEQMPNFEPHDWYVDNYMVLGETGCSPDPSFSVPQMIDGADLAVLLASWGQDDPITDFNADGVIDGADLAELLARWGPCEVGP